MKKIEIPFGASDSDDYYQEIIIPDGLEAVMEDGKIILRRKETEDEKIKKALIGTLNCDAAEKCLNSYGINKFAALAWLEKQGRNNNQNWKPSKEQISALEHFVRSIGESGYASPYDNNTKLLYSLIDDLYELEKQGKQKPADKVEIDFKIGDWIVENGVDRTPIQITAFKWDNGVITKVEFNNDAEMYIELLKYYHKWTIQEARDGDVLVSEYNKPFIYNGKHISDSIGAHCGIDIHDRFIISTTDYDWTDYKVEPATKEQRNLLFQEMKEMGWEWDAEKKKLKGCRKQSGVKKIL